MKQSKELSDDALELRRLKLDLLDRLSEYEITVKEIYSYEGEIRALLDYPSDERAKRFNCLVQNIISKHMRAVK